MSKKKYPVTKFRVPILHPKHEVDWVVWAADKDAARVCARWSFTAKHGYAPTYVGLATIYARRRPSMMLSMIAAACAAVSWDADPYRRAHRMAGGHIFGD